MNVAKCLALSCLLFAIPLCLARAESPTIAQELHRVICGPLHNCHAYGTCYLDPAGNPVESSADALGELTLEINDDFDAIVISDLTDQTGFLSVGRAGALTGFRSSELPLDNYTPLDKLDVALRKQTTQEFERNLARMLACVRAQVVRRAI